MSAPRLLAARFVDALRRGDNEAARAAAQEGFEYYNRRDLDPVRELLDPAIEWIPPSQSLESPQRGLGAVREMLRRWLEGWAELRIEVEEVFWAADVVVLFVRQSGRGLASGVEVENRVAFLWRIEEARVVRFEVVPRRADALRAAGLSPALAARG